MKSIYFVTLLIIIFSKLSYAETPSDIPELISLAKQHYKSENYEKSISLYKQASSLGSPKAMLNLSSIYKYGKATDKDMTLSNKYLFDAKAIYEKRAINGDPDAQFNLGNIYNYNIKPAKEMEAYKWYLKAANNGHMLAQYAVAGILDRGTLEPEIKRDYKEAMKWYEKSAKQGNSRAARYLAYRNNNNLDLVLKWCMPVAIDVTNDQSSKCAELLHKTISRKIYSKKYREKSIKIIKDLASHGVIMSQVTLSQMYKQGDILNKDIKQSEIWSNRAYNTALSRAKDGDKAAQYQLAFLYRKGIGTDVSLDKARQWLDKAAKQGYKPAIKELRKFNK